jgi:hypothetical protein
MSRSRDVEQALKWLKTNTAPVSRTNDKAVLREVFDALEYAHELKLLTANRLSEG